jgi:hypothetical protein
MRSSARAVQISAITSWSSTFDGRCACAPIRL